ncbi:MAG: toxin-antitoxin system HicB family antitoxin [Chloroflexi bacterium]|jgi:antitoxin HicB|nr:toxin-antitoxin system HicB family antitoxin [Chloroflexota bacterium]
MNEAERLLEKLAGVPVIEPTAEEQKILDEYDADMAAGKASEYRSLDKILKEREFSGKLNVRIPKNLHRDLSLEAKTQGVSLNQYIAYVLASRKR